MKVKGSFEVTMEPKPVSGDADQSISLNRMKLEKCYEGALSATSWGEMLSFLSPVKGSAGYVAIELVKGVLEGKSGSFTLQHYGVMQGNKNRLILEILPDSATDELIGLSGQMKIEHVEGMHYYELDYQLS